MKRIIVQYGGSTISEVYDKNLSKIKELIKNITKHKKVKFVARKNKRTKTIIKRINDVWISYLNYLLEDDLLQRYLTFEIGKDKNETKIFYNETQGRCNNETGLKEFLIKYIFCYENYKDGKIVDSTICDRMIILRNRADDTCFCRERHEKLLMGIKACPYCNLEYLERLKDNKGKDIINYTFDHYASKEKYPFFAISLYNLIPTCTICNSIIKGKVDFLESKEEYIQPYFDDFDDIARFEIQLNGIPENINDFPGQFTIELKKKNNSVNDNDFKKAENTVKFFKVKERIQQNHSDYIQEILVKIKSYSSDYSKSIEAMGFNASQRESIIFGNYIAPEDINKRPLSKLTIDIHNQFRYMIYKGDSPHNDVE